MIINKKKNLPARQPHRNTSMYVFIYYTNNRRFCLGYYDFDSELWIDGDGMVINDDFLWCYLPVKQMKLFIQNMSNGNTRPRIFTIDGERYKMFTLEYKGKSLNIASYGLDQKILQKIDENRYSEVRYIDEMYGYVLDEETDENDYDAIMRNLEEIYEEE